MSAPGGSGHPSAIGVFTFCVGVVDDQAKAHATSHRGPLQHLRSPSELPNAAIGRRPMYSLMPTGLPSLSSMKFISGRRTSVGLPSRISNFVLIDEPTTCSGGTP